MKDDRIQVYRFFNAGSLTADAKGNLSTFTSHPIVGTILKLGIGVNNFTSTGSVLLITSGVIPDVLAAMRGVAAGAIIQPVIPGTLNTGAASTVTEIQPPANDVIQLVGSGLGAGKSGTLLSIWYK